MNKDGLIKELLKKQIIAYAYIRKFEILGDSFLDQLYSIITYDTLAFDYIPIPKDDLTKNSDGDLDGFCRDWHYEQIVLISEEVELLYGIYPDISNKEEIDLLLDEFLKETYKYQIQ